MASGQLRIRIAASLHDHLIEQARCQGVSLNQWIATLLAGGSGFKQT